MPEYRYELRHGDEVIATGHLNSEQPFEVGAVDVSSVDEAKRVASIAEEERRIIEAERRRLGLDG